MVQALKKQDIEVRSRMDNFLSVSTSPHSQQPPREWTLELDRQAITISHLERSLAQTQIQLQNLMSAQLSRKETPLPTLPLQRPSSPGSVQLEEEGFQMPSMSLKQNNMVSQEPPLSAPITTQGFMGHHTPAPVIPEGFMVQNNSLPQDPSKDRTLQQLHKSQQESSGFIHPQPLESGLLCGSGFIPPLPQLLPAIVTPTSRW